MPETAVEAFLSAAGWANAEIQPLAGDASSRRYSRLKRSTGEDTAVLMEAPGAPDDGCHRFVDIARHLSSLGFSAPGFVAANPDAGLLLLEDLGDAVFARVVEANPESEQTLYFRAVEWLILLHKTPVPGTLPRPDAVELAAMTAPAADWYCGLGSPDPGFSRRIAEALEPPLREVLITTPEPVFVHRDFHAENLVDLPERSGVARVGVLDFQDAWAGHPVYDLVSLIEDARRALSPGLSAHLLNYYTQLSGMESETVENARAVLGAQRNLRILGVFARLSRLHGKPRYIDMIPRVWAHLQTDLQHPALSDLRRILDDHMPNPSPDHLSSLRIQCQTNPTP